MGRGKRQKVFGDEIEAPTVGSSDDDSVDFGPEPVEAPENGNLVVVAPAEPFSVEEESGSLEVKDVDSVEFSGMQESFRKEYRMIGPVKYEVLIFPRLELCKRFEDNRGMLVLPKVTASEWFQKILKDHGFKHLHNFITDAKGRYLIRSKQEDAYEVSQRYFA